ncbi:MAG: hypothetical protein KIS80_07465 [Anaerolineales bacterium]|nr:hypothetical protein [Anaerolineales bacterium]
MSSKGFFLAALAWLLALLPAYFLSAFFAALPPNPVQLVLQAWLVISLIGWIVTQGLDLALKHWRAPKLREDWPTWLALGLVGRFTWRVIEIGLSFEGLLPLNRLLLPANSLPLFALASAMGLASLIFLQVYGKKHWPAAFQNARGWLESHWQGLLMAALFFVLYFVLANVVNRMDFNLNNVFFAADSHQWQLRAAHPYGYTMEMRAVHPLAFFVLRPITFLMAFLLGTDTYQAMKFLLGLLGGTQIYLAWILITRLTQRPTYAVLIASLFGISTANLVFSPLMESYMASAFLLVLFYVLLQRGAAVHWLLLNAVAVFGVTISNLVQVMLGFFLADMRIKRVALFALAVLVISAGLNLAHAAIYPDSALYFVPEKIGGETQHLQLGSTPEEFAARANIVSRDVFLFSAVAPQPFLLTQEKDERGEFPKFNFMLGPNSARLTGLGKVAAPLWTALLLSSVAGLALSLRQEKLSLSNRYALAFLGCVMFNYIFHMVYGYEPFLYAVDWNYALFFFVALGLQRWAHHWPVTVALVGLLGLLSLNNLAFIHFLFSNIAPYILGLVG